MKLPDQPRLREANDVDIAVTTELHTKLRSSEEWEKETRYSRIFLKKDAVGMEPATRLGEPRLLREGWTPKTSVNYSFGT